MFIVDYIHIFNTDGDKIDTLEKVKKEEYEDYLFKNKIVDGNHEVEIIDNKIHLFVIVHYIKDFVEVLLQC